MLFTGEYEHTIDGKQRLAVPAEIRTRLEASGVAAVFYVVPGPNGALWLWPEATFELMAGAMEQSLLPGEEVMEFEELLFSQAARTEMDKAGRIRVPERLLSLVDIDGQVVVLGVRDHLELRNPEDWATRRAQRLATQGEIMLRARRALAARRAKTDGGDE